MGFIPSFDEFQKLCDNCALQVEYWTQCQVLAPMADALIPTLDLLMKDDDAHSFEITRETLFGKNTNKVFMGYHNGVFVVRARPVNEIMLLERLHPDFIVLYRVSLCGGDFRRHDIATKKFICCTVRHLMARYYLDWGCRVESQEPTHHQIDNAKRELRGNISQHVTELLSMMALLKIIDTHTSGGMQDNDGIISYIAPAYRPIAFVLD